MNQTADVLVLGGGIAGAAAALAASRAGARVTVIRAGPGATALAAGGWTAEPPAGLAQALADAGLALHPCTGRLPHPYGALTECAAAPLSHAHASISAGAERILACGIAGLPSFRPAALAALWSDAAGLMPGAIGAVTLTLEGTPPGGWSPVSLAARLEEQPHLLGAAVAHAAREHGAARAILPAVLGIDGHDATLQAVQNGSGIQVGEALGVAPSIPGWRLDRALLRALAQAGVAVVQGRVVARRADGARVASVTVRTATATSAFSARSIVLATGGFVGGGIAADATYTESALGCEIAVERFTRTISDARASLVLTDPARLEPQPLLGIGVHTNERAQPLRGTGGVEFDNVFVAGSIRAGVETAAAGLGAVAHEGWRAGELAAAITS